MTVVVAVSLCYDGGAVSRVGMVTQTIMHMPTTVPMDKPRGRVACWTTTYSVERRGTARGGRVGGRGGQNVARNNSFRTSLMMILPNNCTNVSMCISGIYVRYTAFIQHIYLVDTQYTLVSQRQTLGRFVRRILFKVTLQSQSYYRSCLPAI